MCDPMTIIGTGLGIAQGVAAASGQQAAARKNQRAAVDNQRINLIQNQREMVLEKDASVKEAHDAALAQSAAKATAVASSGGFSGSTAGARVSEQGRQGALSISKAEDRADAAEANYIMEQQAEQIKTANYIETQETSPMAHVFNIAASGLQGYQQFSSLSPKATKAGR